jgi:hypothetical protein
MKETSKGGSTPSVPFAETIRPFDLGSLAMI